MKLALKILSGCLIVAGVLWLFFAFANLVVNTIINVFG